jgi:hypothetical protein
MVGASEVEDGKGILLAGVHLEGKKGKEGGGKGGEKALSSAAFLDEKERCVCD